jgi:hypothetical protein
MWNMNWRSTAALILFCLLFELHQASGQVTTSEPFTPIEKDRLADANPTQSQRLDHLEHLPSTQSVHVFRMNRNAVLGDQVKISIPNDKTFILSRTGGETNDSKDFTWVGEVQGEQRGSATLVARNGEITGSISTAQGLYRISPLGDGAYAIVKVNTRRLPPEEPPAKDPNK